MSSSDRIRTKLCGITTVADARLAAEAGADFIRVLVEVEQSPRCLTVEEARPICVQSRVPVVALLFNRDADQIRRVTSTLHPQAIQLLGQETPALVRELAGTEDHLIWKSMHLPPSGEGETDVPNFMEEINAFIDAGVHGILLDTVTGAGTGNRRYGGTGRVNDWETARTLVAKIRVPTLLAGGIDPDNVGEAIETVRPYGIDLASGVEARNGGRPASIS